MSTPLPKVLALVIMVVADVYLVCTAVAGERWGWLVFSIVLISATVGVAVLPWDRPSGGPQP